MNERMSKHIGVTHLLGKKSIFSKNRTEPRHDSMWKFCAAAQIEPELQRISMPRHEFSSLYWAATWSLKNCHISIFTRKWGFKRTETKMAREFWLFGGLQACGCARVWDFGEIEAKIGALEEIWSFNYLVFFPFIFLSFLMSFMAILSLCICAFILTMSS